MNSSQRTLALIAASAAAAAASAAPAQAELAGWSSTAISPQVCQVDVGAPSSDCNAATLTASASHDGHVAQRIVLRLSAAGQIPADAEVIAATLTMKRVGGSDPLTWRWGTTFSTGAAPETELANDQYFATGATGDDDQPRGRVGGTLGSWQLGEALDRARSQSSAPLDLYLDGTAEQAADATFVGPAGAASDRPTLTIQWRRAAGFRSNDTIEAMFGTTSQAFAVNPGTGNLSIHAVDATNDAFGDIDRWYNSLGAGRWASGFEARTDIVDGATVLRAPTGEAVSVDSTTIWGNFDYQNDAIDQQSGNHPTSASTIDEVGGHRAFPSLSGLLFTASDNLGSYRQFRLPGFSSSGAVNTGTARSISTTATAADGTQTTTSAAITDDASTLQIAASDGTQATGTRRASDKQLTKWKLVSGATTTTPVTYAYTGARLTGVTTSVGQTTYAYGNGGRVTSVSDPDGATVTLDYDGQGRVRSLVRTLADPGEDGGSAEWRYLDTVDEHCDPAAGADRSVIETMSSGDKVFWCVAGNGTIVDHHELEPAIAPLPEVTCADGDDDCALPFTPLATGARAGLAHRLDDAPQDPPVCPGDRSGVQDILGIQDDSWDDDPITSQPLGRMGTIFESRSLQCIKPKYARRIVPWNVSYPASWAPKTDMLKRLSALKLWIQHAQSAGMTPIISFNECPFGESKSCKKPPTATKYKAAMQAFRADPVLATVSLFTAFNEPNHKRGSEDYLARTAKDDAMTSHASDHPNGDDDGWRDDHSGAYLAGHYFRIMTKVCQTSCNVLAGDFADVDALGHLPGSYERYLRQYTQGMKRTRGTAWALHYYRALRLRGANPAASCAQTSITAGTKNTGCWQTIARTMKTINTSVRGKTGKTPVVNWWLTEGGVIYKDSGGAESRWSSTPTDPTTLAYRGPADPADADAQTDLQKTQMFRATAALLDERAAIESQWGAKINAVINYEFVKPNGTPDSAMIGQIDDGDLTNKLDESERPAYVAWCLRVWPNNPGNCWRVDPSAGGGGGDAR